MKKTTELTIHFVLLILAFSITILLLYFGKGFLGKVLQFDSLCFFIPATVLLCLVVAISAISLARHRYLGIMTDARNIDLQAIAGLPEDFIKNNPEKIAELLSKL